MAVDHLSFECDREVIVSSIDGPADCSLTGSLTYLVVKNSGVADPIGTQHPRRALLAL